MPLRSRNNGLEKGFGDEQRELGYSDGAAPHPASPTTHTTMMLSSMLAQSVAQSLTLALAPLGAAPGAQPAEAATLFSQRAPTQETPAKPRPKAAKFIVKTQQGRTFRGLARKHADGSFEIKSGGRWITLPGQLVASSTLEKDALKELGRRRKDKSIASADLLDWALDQGLLAEAVRFGDEAIEARPQDLDLRAVCSSGGSILAGMPEKGAADELAGLRSVGTRGQGFAREAVIERIMTAAPRAELLEGFQADLASKDARVRSFALFALGRLFPKEDARGVLLHAMYDPSEQARIAAARAVGDFGASEVGAPLVKALSSATPAVRIRAAEALGHAREDKFVPPLVDRLYALTRAAGSVAARRTPHSYLFVGTQRAYIQDFDVEVARFSAVADPVINTLTTGSVLDVGVINTAQVTILQEIATVRRSLGRITGQGARWKARQWKKWWESDASLPYRGPNTEETSPPSSHGGDASGLAKPGAPSR